MKQSDRKLITEKLLDECFHDVPDVNFPWETRHAVRTCNKCGEQNKLLRRNFDTPADFFDVIEKLVEKGEWEDFYYYFLDKSPLDHMYNCIAWLLSDIERFCQLVADWLKEKKE
jgi:hypothetical protein